MDGVLAQFLLCRVEIGITAGWRSSGRDVSLLDLLLSGRAMESMSDPKKTELEKDSESSGHR